LLPEFEEVTPESLLLPPSLLLPSLLDEPSELFAATSFAPPSFDPPSFAPSFEPSDPLDEGALLRPA
jgi:hypothetical protein